MADKYITEHGQIAYAFEGISLNDWKYGCFECKHLSESYHTCPAFPNGIPDELIIGKRIHRKVLPGQKGKIVFEPLSDDLIKKRFEEIRIDEVLKSIGHEIKQANAEINNSVYPDINLVFFRRGLEKALKIIMKVFKFKFVDPNEEDN